jgi:hypothetical protein
MLHAFALGCVRVERMMEPESAFESLLSLLVERETYREYPRPDSRAFSDRRMSRAMQHVLVREREDWPERRRRRKVDR